jgi:hypothetical protein
MAPTQQTVAAYPWTGMVYLPAAVSANVAAATVGAEVDLAELMGLFWR